MFQSEIQDALSEFNCFVISEIHSELREGNDKEEVSSCGLFKDEGVNILDNKSESK